MKLPILLLAASALFAADTRIADSLMNGNAAEARKLIGSKTADVKAAQGDGMTPLHWAVYHADLETAKQLLTAGADPNAQTRNGAISPIFLACANGDAAMIRLLLDAGVSAKAAKPNGTTPLMMAAASGKVDAVKVLVEAGAPVNDKESVRGQTALMFAANLNRTEVVKYLAAHHADLNLATNVKKMERVRFDQDGNVVEDKLANAAPAKPVEPPDPQGDLNTFARAAGLKTVDYKPAAFRARAGDAAARAPRRIGADFLGGMTALLYAAREGHMATVQALVEAGASINLVSHGDKMTPLVMAIINGHLDIAKYLLDRGADPNLASIGGVSPLFAVIDVQWAPKAWYPQPSVDQEKTRYMELLQALLDKGANPNTQLIDKPWFRSFTNDYTWVDPAGATPFWRAAQSSDVNAMRLLIKHGADPKIAAKSGDTALHAAAGIGWAANWSTNAPIPGVEAVKYCVELGLDVNAADLRGYTPLHGAAYLGNNDMVNFLVSKGGDVKAKSKSGDTVADMANGPTRFGQPHPETVALLESLGSPNSHNCRSDQCVVAAKSNIYDFRTTADFVAIDELDKFAKAVGLDKVEYRVDLKNAPEKKKATTSSDR